MADLTQMWLDYFLYDIPYRNKESAMFPEGMEMTVCYKSESLVYHENWEVLCIYHFCTDKIFVVLQFEVVQKNKYPNLFMLRKDVLIAITVAFWGYNL